MKVYADTNFFTRVYLKLPESDEAEHLLIQARAGRTVPLPITGLLRMELLNAFEFSVWLGKQGGHPSVSPGQAAVALANFKEDLAAGTFLRAVRPDSVELESLFEEMSLRHTAKHGFRAYDLLHVASARLLGSDTFFSFDQRAKKLARLEGLEIIN